MKTQTYGEPSTGCYLDQGNRNSTDHDIATIEIAEEFGYQVPTEDREIIDAARNEDYERGEFLNEVADAAIDWLNEQETRENLSWYNCGDRGAFGLWDDSDSD